MTAVQRIDPRLSRQLAAAGDEEVVQAIVIVGSGDDPASRPPDASPAAGLIAEVSARVGRSPVRVRQVPRGNAVIVTACVVAVGTSAPTTTFFARPKSSTFARPAGVITMFAVFRSRCRTSRS